MRDLIFLKKVLDKLSGLWYTIIKKTNKGENTKCMNFMTT